MQYEQAIEYITEALKFGINPGLERVAAACSALGDPYKKYPVVQVTGTNGKTSVSRMTAAILGAHGLKTGLFTSPHLSDYTERIVIDGSDISREDFASAVESVMPALEEAAKKYGELTEFEILTVAAINHFAAVGVDVAVFEVGLGGRWDATSVTEPRISVITNVELDHVDRLGSTIAEIAWDKAHIIKPGSIAVCGDLDPEALGQVEERCQRVGSELKLAGRDFRTLDCSDIEGGALISIEGIYGEYRGLPLRVLGAFQEKNALLAMAVSEAFIQGPVSEGKSAKALGEVLCPGRMEIISKQPLVLVDGAHNPAGMRRLLYSVKHTFGNKPITVVLSASADKDIDGMLAELRGVDRMILTQNASYRSATAEDLAAKAGSSRFEIEPDLSRAIEKAVAYDRDGLVVITGSLYAVGEAREIVADQKELFAKG